MRLQSLLSLSASLALATGSYAQTTAPRPAQPTQPPAQTSPAQPNVQQTNPYPAPLHTMPDVSKSLNLNQQQVNQLNQITNQTQTRYRDNYAKLNNLTPEERAARTNELNRQYQTDWMKGAQGILNQDQYTRYQQLHYQYGGFNSLANPEVQQRLNLTPEQLKNMRGDLDWSTKRLQDINQVSVTDRNKADQEYRTYQKQYQERFNKFLTPEQQKAWREMTGEPYTFQPSWSTSPRP